MTHTAWTMPGIKPNKVNKILIQKDFPKPTVKKTPRGGRIMANRILKILINYALC